MSKYLKDLFIGQYRGIKNLELKALNCVNVIVGDNNSGKSSILESIYLLRAPFSFDNVLRTARMRDVGVFTGPNLYTNFLSIFPKNNEIQKIYIQSIGDAGEISLEIEGEEKSVLIEEKDVQIYPSFVRSGYTKRLLGQEASAFVGRMFSSINSKSKETDIRLTNYSRYSLSRNNRDMIINIDYLSPISHITENAFNNIVKNDTYKDICIQLIRLFDRDIEDLVYIKDDNSSRAVEYVRSKKKGLMPLSTYGDGIKKVLSLANGIIKAQGGVLLIDEIDTSIHYKYYGEIFNFLIKAAMKWDVQIFITTHSLEAIDEILKTQNYNGKIYEGDDLINVITLKKDVEGDLKVRSMKGSEVYRNRELFGFEVRS